MAKYTLSWHGTLVDNEEGWHIPNDPDNRHFQEYQSWKAQGNWPDFELENIINICCNFVFKPIEAST